MRLGPLLNWRQVDNALRYGFYGLHGGSSVANLLAEHRSVRSWSTLPRLTEKQILGWADAYFKKHGRWPTEESGPVGTEDWRNIDWALREGGRGLSGRSSLPNLLAEHRGHRHNFNTSILSLRRVMRWADERHARHGAGRPAIQGQSLERRKHGPGSPRRWRAVPGT